MDYSIPFKLWNVPPPSFIDALISISADKEFLVKGSRVSIPWPFFTPQQMVNAFSILDDWEIPKNLVPISGDFHDLLCIDIENSGEIVVLDDSRIEIVRFSSADELMNSLQVSESEYSEKGIIERKSWFGF